MKEENPIMKIKTPNVMQLQPGVFILTPEQLKFQRKQACQEMIEYMVEKDRAFEIDPLQAANDYLKTL